MCILNSKCAFQKANVCLNRTELATKRTPGWFSRKSWWPCVRVYFVVVVVAVCSCAYVCFRKLVLFLLLLLLVLLFLLLLVLCFRFCSCLCFTLFFALLLF